MKDISTIQDVMDFDRVVILNPMPTPAPMERIEGILKTKVAGPVAVVKLQPGTRYATQINRQKQGKLDSLGDFCFLDVRTEHGQIESGFRENRNGGVYKEPKGASLKSSRQGDGFILFEPLTEHPIAERAFREMRIAPQGGYIPELIFPETSGSRVYFYCYLEGKYGKGFIVRPSLREAAGETTALSVLKILVNPTGDRNVATLD